jgi:hypothetical protein
MERSTRRNWLDSVCGREITFGSWRSKGARPPRCSVRFRVTSGSPRKHLDDVRRKTAAGIGNDVIV